MSATLTEPPMPKKPAGNRDRVDLRIEREIVNRIIDQANRKGLNISSYIRQAVISTLERDESEDPRKARRK